MSRVARHTGGPQARARSRLSGLTLGVVRDGLRILLSLEVTKRGMRDCTTMPLLAYSTRRPREKKST